MTAQVYRCIQCRTSLSQQLYKQKIWFRCSRCLSGFVPLEFMSAILPEFNYNKLSYEIRSEKIKSARSCPCCGVQMIKVFDVAGSSTIEACNSCHLVWLDPNEGAKIKRDAAEKKPHKIKISSYDDDNETRDELIELLYPRSYHPSRPVRHRVILPTDIIRFLGLEKMSEKHPTTAFLIGAAIVIMFIKIIIWFFTRWFI